MSPRSGPLLSSLLAVLMVLAACGGSDEPAGGGDGAGDPIPEFATDLDGLRQVYPLGDLEVESVRWRVHTDYVQDGDSLVLDDLPAQDAEPIFEAVFVFADEAIRDAALAGRSTTVQDLPAWYPDALITPDPVEIVVATEELAALPGEVSAFPDIAPYVLVRYAPVG